MVIPISQIRSNKMNDCYAYRIYFDPILRSCDILNVYIISKMN